MELSQDFKQKLSDKKWRLNNLYSIKDRNGNKIPFVMNAAQEEFYDNMHSRNLILKARQLGFSTLINIYMFDSMLFNNYTACGTTADSLDNAKKLLRKIDFAYENLDEGLKASITQRLTNSTQSMSFDNGSNIDVGVSMRSDTKQIIHISELGKISVRTPEKAQEIKSGTLNSVSKDGIVFIESTAEGMGGLFYDMVQEAKNNKNPGKMDFKLFFYPWWKEKSYVTDDAVIIPDRLNLYFAKLKEEHGINLTAEQKAWYVKKEREQGESMKREFPSYVDEAFEQSTEGVVYQHQIANAYNFERIGAFNLRVDLPVYTVWDLGWGDSTAIITFQVVNKRPRVLWYDEGCHEELPYYIDILQTRKNKYGFAYGDLYLPHDGSHGSLTGKVSEQLKAHGFNVVVMPRDTDLIEAIIQAKELWHIADFNEKTSELLLRHLGAYRYEFNERLGVWKKEPRHDEHSHGADAFRYMLKAVNGYIITPEEQYEEMPEYFENRNSVTGY